jgi:sporulation protein YabP
MLAREAMDMKSDAPPPVERPHTLTIEGRSRAVITGVTDVDNFNDTMIVMNTSAGAMTLIGSALHISRLNLDDGQLLVEGQIDALEYDERARGKGGLSRLFK